MRILSVSVPVVLLGLVVGCGTKSDADVWGDTTGKPRVIASFAPIWCFAENVAGPDAVVKPLMTSQGPHHFDGTATEARLFQKADLVLVNGLGLDDKRIKKLADASRNKNLKVVDLGGKIDPKTLLESDGCPCGHDHGDDDGHDHGGVDPHVWLGPDQAIKMVEGIRDALKAADPAHAAGYESRAAAYIAKLTALKDEGKALLKDKTDRKLVTFHGSQNYFANAFGLKIAGVVQSTPGKEPSTKELDALVAACNKDKVRVIAVEPQYASKSAAERIVAHLKNVPDPVVIALDPLETANESELNADWYVAKMRANLAELARALR
jgi:ABC-type Zn uptake system ZnuABC Zn-binding protein ZnuA